MSALLIGYARVSTDEQDLTAQRDALLALGVTADRTYVDHGLTGANRERPGLREALAACRAGDTLPVTKLDRLARSLPDAREILEDLTGRDVKLRMNGAVHDPTDPVGRLLFNGRRVRRRRDPAAHARGHAGRKGEGALRGATRARKRAKRDTRNAARYGDSMKRKLILGGLLTAFIVGAANIHRIIKPVPS